MVSVILLNLIKYNLQITDTTIIKTPNTGGYLLQQGIIKFNQKNDAVKFRALLNQQKQTHQRAKQALHFYKQ